MAEEGERRRRLSLQRQEPVKLVSQNSKKQGWWSSCDRNTIDEDNENKKSLFELLLEQPMDTKVSIKKFLTEIEKSGIRRTDPRLKELIQNLRSISDGLKDVFMSHENLWVDRETFQSVIADNIVIIMQIFRQEFSISNFYYFKSEIKSIFENCKDTTEGKVADYIPQLARVSKRYWGMSVCTADGQRYSLGDSDVNFTLQSVSKPLLYALALQRYGKDVVHEYVGCEPSGGVRDELLLDSDGKPHNPMLSSGYIMVCALLRSLTDPNVSSSEMFVDIQRFFKDLAGGNEVNFNNSVFLSEKERGNRQFALGYYMKDNQCLPQDADLHKCLDVCFQCYSMEMTCDSLAVIAGTLANGGICPITEARIIDSEVVKNVVSLMYSCGMYNNSGQFAFNVGLPAKSGLSGGLMIVVPNLLGIALWSPLLDTFGNSVRGMQFCHELVDVFGFHQYSYSKSNEPLMLQKTTKGSTLIRLLYAAANGDLATLQRLHLDGDNMGDIDYDGRTALHIAATEGHLECVRFLLESCQVCPNPKDRWDQTPLDDATSFNRSEVADLLKDYEERWALAMSFNEEEENENKEESQEN